MVLRSMSVSRMSNGRHGCSNVRPARRATSDQVLQLLPGEPECFLYSVGVRGREGGGRSPPAPCPRGRDRMG